MKKNVITLFFKGSEEIHLAHNNLFIYVTKVKKLPYRVKKTALSTLDVKIDDKVLVMCAHIHIFFNRPIDSVESVLYI